MSLPPAGDPNPYVSPGGPSSYGGVPTGAVPTSLEYGRLLSYIFENPNWLMNLIWLFLCQVAAMIIPIVPQMVSTGYQFEVIDSLLESRGTRYRDFDINRIVEYLVRGLWPVLAILVVALGWGALLVLLIGIVGGCLTGAAALAGEEAAGGVASLGGLLVMVLTGVSFVLLMLVMIPVGIRAGITQDFGSAFDMGWIKSFVAKMWLDIILSTLVIGLVSGVISTCTCFVGLILLIPVAPLVTAHLWFQFYVIFLARGGQPITIRPAAAQFMPPRGPMPT
jgi:hypothetical protein